MVDTKIMKLHIHLILSLFIVSYFFCTSSVAEEPTKNETRNYIKDLLKRGLIGIGGIRGRTIWKGKETYTFELYSVDVTSKGDVKIKWEAYDDRENKKCNLQFNVADINYAYGTQKWYGYYFPGVICEDNADCVRETCVYYEKGRFEEKLKESYDDVDLYMNSERNANKLNNAFEHLESFYHSYFDK